MRLKSEDFLLDSNVLIYYSAGLLVPNANAQITDILNAGRGLISIVSYIEALSVFDAPESEIATIRQLVDGIAVRHLTSEIAFTAIRIRQQVRMKLPDAIIAATALLEGCPIITNDLRGFHRIEGLELIRAELNP